MEGLVKDYLIEEFSPGQKNLLKIYSEPLLEELINYNESDYNKRTMGYNDNAWIKDNRNSNMENKLSRMDIASRK